jgi:hypothetical protein
LLRPDIFSNRQSFDLMQEPNAQCDAFVTIRPFAAILSLPQVGGELHSPHFATGRGTQKALTGGTAATVPDGYEIASGDADWGYRVRQPDRRKVLLASRSRLRDVSTTGPKGMPGGRLVSARSQMAIGPFASMGCVSPGRMPT